MTKYEQGKERARAKAQALQVYLDSLSWWEIYENGEELTKLAKRYGLLKEFRENGLI